MSQWLDQVAIANAGFFSIPRGAYPQKEREKFNNLGRKPFQTVERLPGTEKAEWTGANPAGAQVYQQAFPFLDQVHNREIGRHNASAGGG